MTTVLMLGSAPMAVQAAGWPRCFDTVLAINNAWRVRPDWDYSIYPWDFDAARVPVAGAGQVLVTEADFVPAQNAYGGFVYAGATMAYTAAYWALATLKPRVLAVFGCDMHYPAGQTHFYGTGTPDPLRADITLRSLEAKSVRLMVLAAAQGCAVVNLSQGVSRLLCPRAALAEFGDAQPLTFDPGRVQAAQAREAELGYFAPSGRYWEDLSAYDVAEIDALDALWLACLP
ncbi:hypothetical protein GCM10010873_27840 [Cypionkella aquatica]|uniref:Uncharacterized protein n=1 Tax=Cypionkella aquatica TaxID=1756042 RepID=A0AA37TYB2_9RHOB|nr:hypothetical protein [Cypionkella aquatica]GLS87810.1 hypothetical protein GCM10010873_27840 [Cypionkella aquatica]